MGRRSGFPDLRDADSLSQMQIEAEILRRKQHLIIVGYRGGASHQATRTLANWERVLERRFGVTAPHRPARSRDKFTK